MSTLGKGLCPLKSPVYEEGYRRPAYDGSCLTPIVRRSAVSPFVEHHQQSIRFQYSCFDRMLLNAVVQPM
jgi:hypothetical protein